MRKLSRTIAAAMIATAAAGGTYAFFASPMVPSAEARWKEHPRLESAHNALRDAKEYLEHAPHDFHGHRVEAIKAIDYAMHQVAICAEEEGRSSVSQRPQQLAEHPKLHHAMEELKGCREYLHNAPHDFRGHREEAIKGIDAAIHHIEICMND